MVEPCSVGYNAVIERGGGIRPGDNVVICGTGPVGLAACRELKTMGGATVIVSEPQPERAALALKMGADYVIDPTKVDFTEEVLRLTGGMGASLYLEGDRPADGGVSGHRAVHLGGPHAQRDRRGRGARRGQDCPSPAKCCRCAARAIVGSQGHSGHGTFPRVIESMAAGMDMLPMITKKITLDEVPENIIALQTDRKNMNYTYIYYD